MSNSARKKVILCVLDGWGIRNPKGAVDAAVAKDDATQVATFFWKLWETYPHSQLCASGEAVGLPPGQMGNSEVGHTTIGLGRVVKQDLARINDAISDGTLAAKLSGFIENLKQTNASAHVLGLASPGGVHSHISHMQAVVNIIASADVRVYVHAILDGRDTLPKSAQQYLHEFQSKLPKNAIIVSICGRFFAMDRDNRWERTKAAYSLIAEQEGMSAADSVDSLLKHNDSSDEFVEPSMIGSEYKQNQKDGLIMINFRSDRGRQIIRALADPTFDKFQRKTFPRFAQIITMTEYDSDNLCQSLFTKESTEHSLGDIFSENNLRQIRIAETEKYAHVTHFFNGGREQPVDGEERVFVPSPTVSTYDQSPQMNAEGVTEKVIKAMQEDVDVIVVNYANADMLGHTGKLAATKVSIEKVDECLMQLEENAQKHEYTLFIVADHGNAEQMQNADGSAHTMHTTNLVPFIVLDKRLCLRESGELADVAPTILQHLGIRQPREMTGSSLLALSN
ncbi:MAG: 2,3-bisphosphoglycerate-independent phosphoglycerate mutase [Holosporales bacterium]|jgi:2,3-bisphosphoglycerate-independent phosphoglycerate mutase|nr:2,3-bisphosphoglycerate-independent phosphoglycerate mutase [Holosporales bacterium]